MKNSAHTLSRGAIVLIASLISASLFVSVPVRADSPHFTKVTATLESDGDVAVKFKEAGLGANQTINYVASADAKITCVCVNHNGSCPAAANKVDNDSNLTTPGTFSSGKNGTISQTLTITPECPSSDPPTCGNGQVLRLSAVSYTNIEITDTTNHVSEDAVPSTLAATFFTCP
jgi:hypothetical protein